MKKIIPFIFVLLNIGIAQAEVESHGYVDRNNTGMLETDSTNSVFGTTANQLMYDINTAVTGKTYCYRDTEVQELGCPPFPYWYGRKYKWRYADRCDDPDLGYYRIITDWEVVDNCYYDPPPPPDPKKR